MSDLQQTQQTSQPASARELITLVIPARNEAENITRLEEEVLAVTSKLPYDFEFIVIDNGSTDATGSLVKALYQRDPRWKYVRFSRNFTVEMSIAAGYHFSKGDAIIVLYSDLQDPPEVIPQFIEQWKGGYDVVYGVRTVRPGDPQWRNFAVKLAYKLIASMADIAIPVNAGDFRLISRRVRDQLEFIDEANRYTRGLIAWVGYPQIGVTYERKPRKAGKSNAPFWSIVFFTFNAITSFSLKPLRLFTFLGFILLGLSFLGILIYSYLFITGNPPAGITTLIVLSLLGIGLNSLGIGVLGEYLGRTYAEVKRRPLYVIQEQVGLDPQYVLNYPLPGMR